jgi:hypothetical protein
LDQLRFEFVDQSVAPGLHLVLPIKQFPAKLCPALLQLPLLPLPM